MTPTILAAKVIIVIFAIAVGLVAELTCYDAKDRPSTEKQRQMLGFGVIIGIVAIIASFIGGAL